MSRSDEKEKTSKKQPKVTWDKNGFPSWPDQRLEFAKEISLDEVVPWVVRDAHLTMGTLATFLKRVNKKWWYRFGDSDIFRYVYDYHCSFTEERLREWVTPSNGYSIRGEGDNPPITEKDWKRINQLRKDYHQKCLKVCRNEWKNYKGFPHFTEGRHLRSRKIK